MKNRVCLVLPCNIYAAPYYFRYEKLLDNLHIDFDLIIWNRDLIEEKSSGNIILFNVADVANSGAKTKVIKYFRFASFVKQIIKENKYRKIIFLSTSAGIVAILSLFLKRHYKNHYWIDIRDYSFEWFKPYKLALSIAIKHSYMCSVSSIGYTKFLPKHNYVVTHNIDFSSIEKCVGVKDKKITMPPIRISFIGNIRYYKENERLLQIFKNDNRFLLQYFGMQADVLEDYCKKNRIINVDFHGRFHPHMTAEFYSKTHIINNVYGNSSVDLTTALSNKLYFAASLHMPILVSPNTYMEEITGKYNFGYKVDLNDDNINDKLFEWYMELSDSTCKYEDFLDVVLEEEKKYEELLEVFLK